MDSGCYLNNGRTPSGYSAYERFFLNWLTPRVINHAENDTLSALNSSNEALLVCQGTYHNLRGNNPNPRLFYLLENRQKTGWDAYLPGHGMLITRVNYNSGKWISNNVNTDPNAMGVDIIEANALSASRNPFPGASNIRAYNIVFADTIVKSLTNIEEQSGVITFKFMGGVATVPTDIENINNEEVNIYSSDSKIFIQTTSTETCTVQIFNLTGLLLHTDSFSQTYERNRGALPRGVYFVKVGEKVQKVVW
jgi:hypothetical protein